MLPTSYRVIKGFATFFGVIGILSCICGIIAGIITNPALKEKSRTQQVANSSLTLAKVADRDILSTVF